MRDADLAELLNIEVSTVQYRRNKLGILPFTLRFNFKPEYIKLLGTIPDSNLAKQLGCSITLIRRKRLSLKIKKAFRLVKQTTKWTDESVSKLGTMPDNKIALKFGLSMSSVFKKRKALGIKSYK